MCSLDGWNLSEYYKSFAKITEGYFLMIIGKFLTNILNSKYPIFFSFNFPLGFVGLMANFSAVPILLSKKMANVFNRTLAILALVDSLYILTQMLKNYVHYFSKPVWFCHLYKYVVYFQSVSLVASIYLTVVLALERFLAVSKPVAVYVSDGSGRKWFKVFCYVGPVLTFAFTFSIPHLFEFQCVETPICSKGMKLYSSCFLGISKLIFLCFQNLQIRQNLK